MLPGGSILLRLCYSVAGSILSSFKKNNNSADHKKDHNAHNKNTSSRSHILFASLSTSQTATNKSAAKTSTTIIPIKISKALDIS